MEEKVRALMPALPVSHRRRQTANTDVFSGAQIYDACFCLVFIRFLQGQKQKSGLKAY